MLAERAVDVVLVDLGGSAAGDVETVQQCRAAAPYVPIIALSGDVVGAGDAALAAAGVAAVLAKPLEPRRLIDAIEAAVYGEPASPPSASDAVVTEISDHPRFGRANAEPIDRRAVEALWSLGAGSAFFRDVVDAFGTDARRLLKEIEEAAASGKATDFAAAVQALRYCTAGFSSAHLRDALQAMESVGAAELRQNGSVYVQQLNGEIAKLEASLGDYGKTAGQGSARRE
jgi:two-component system sensor histidine kinase RpfC